MQPIRALAGWPKDGKGFHLPRSTVKPPVELTSKIWPWVEDQMEQIKSTPHELQKGWIASEHFLILLQELRIVLLENSVEMRKRFPTHPMWENSVFNNQHYESYRIRSEEAMDSYQPPNEVKLTVVLVARLEN